MPDLPAEAKKVHIVLGLIHASLVSIKMMADAGCKVKYKKGAVKIIYRNRVSSMAW